MLTSSGHASCRCREDTKGIHRTSIGSCARRSLRVGRSSEVRCSRIWNAWCQLRGLGPQARLGCTGQNLRVAFPGDECVEHRPASAAARSRATESSLIPASSRTRKLAEAGRNRSLVPKGVNRVLAGCSAGRDRAGEEGNHHDH